MGKRRNKRARELAPPSDEAARSFLNVGPYGDPSFFFGARTSDAAEFTSPLTQNPWLASAARSLARNIGGIRSRVYRGKRLQPKTWAAVDDGHPLQKLVDNPNPWMTRSRFWRLHIAYHLERGENVHVLTTADGTPRRSLAETPEMIFPVNPATSTLVKKNGLPHLWKLDTGELVPTFAVMHPYEPDHSGDVFRGLSPLKAAWVDLRADFLAGKMSEAFFDNGASLGGILKSKKRLTDTTAQQKLDRWNAMYGGAGKAQKTAVLDEDTEWQPNARTQRDMEFIELRKWSIAIVAAITGVPKKELAVLEDVNNATAISSDRQYWKSTLVPMIFELEETMWAELFQYIEGGQYFVAWELSSVPALREDEKEKSEIALRYQLMGIKFEDINARLGMQFPPQGALDRLQLLPQNLSPLELVAPSSGVDAAGAPLAAEGSAQDIALNGAQIASLVDLVAKVQLGEIPPESAEQLIMLSVPGITPAAAHALIGPAAEEKKNAPSAPSAPPAGIAPPAPSAPPAKGAVAGGSRPGKGDAAAADQQAAGRGARSRLRSAIASRGDRARSAGAAARARYAQFETRVLKPNRSQYRGRVKSFFFDQKADILAAFDRLVGARLESLDPRFAAVWARGERREAVAALGDRRPAFLEKMRATLDPGAVDRLFADRKRWDEALARLTRPIAAATIEATGGVMVDELGDQFAIDARDPKWTTFLERQGASLVRNVNDETIRWTRDSILADIRDGKDPQEIRDALKSHTAFSTARANRIAITEVGNAASSARFETYASVPDLRHQWLTNNGPAVRDSHKAIDGEVVKVGEAFGNGLKYPHDPSAPAEEVVECHCSAVAVIE